MTAPVYSLASLTNGYPFSSDDFKSSGATPLMRIRDLSSDNFDTYLDISVPYEQLVTDGDLVIGMDGDFNVVLWQRGPAALNQRLCRLRPRPNCDIRFLAYSLPGPLKVINDTQYATTVKHLSSTEVLQSRVPDLALDDQRRIADFLDDQVARIDNIIAARELQLRLLGNEFSAAVHSAISGLHVEAARKKSSLTWLESIPVHWGEPRVCQVARMGTGHTPSRSNAEFWEDCSIPWLTTGDVHRFRGDEIDTIFETAIMISELGLANSAAVLHPAGTVALSRTASAGFSIVMGTDMATSQDFGTWTCGPMLRPHFLLWCLRDMRVDIMGRLAIGSTHKTIYFPDLMSIRIPLPTAGEQENIVTDIRRLHTHELSASDCVVMLIDRLRELKRSLITAAVSGEFDVSTADGSQVMV